jgi:hypothetical protein
MAPIEAPDLREWAAFLRRCGREGSLYRALADGGREWRCGPPLGTALVGTERECFRNAALLASSDPDRYAYCQGYAVSRRLLEAGVCFPVEHAWVLDRRDGLASCPTWADGMAACLGAAFDDRWLRAYLSSSGVWGVSFHVPLAGGWRLADPPTG